MRAEVTIIESYCTVLLEIAVDDGGTAVHAGGTMPVQKPAVTGYSIVSAKSMDEALELAKGCPLVEPKDSAVCVYEALPM